MQETRLLAAILAKNAVAKFWPAGGTHPLLIPVVAGEKAMCRERVMDCLRSEPLERIATQVNPIVQMLSIYIHSKTFKSCFVVHKGLSEPHHA